MRTYEVEDTSDDLVEQISHTIPKNRKPELTKRFVCEAAETLVGQGKTPAQALRYILERSELWAATFARWPKDEQKYAPEAHNWIHDGTYAVSADLWEREDKKAQPRMVNPLELLHAQMGKRGQA